MLSMLELCKNSVLFTQIWKKIELFKSQFWRAISHQFILSFTLLFSLSLASFFAKNLVELFSILLSFFWRSLLSYFVIYCYLSPSLSLTFVPLKQVFEAYLPILLCSRFQTKFPIQSGLLCFCLSLSASISLSPSLVLSLFFYTHSRTLYLQFLFYFAGKFMLS